jgi:hypothetical protein
VYKVFADDDLYLGEMTTDGVSRLFELLPDAWLSIHGGTDMPLSGEVNSATWTEYCQRLPDVESVEAKPQAAVSWCAKDILRKRPNWSIDRCRGFLDDNEDIIQRVMIEAGAAVIGVCLEFDV